MGAIKEIAKEFVPPIAVGIAKRVLHAIDRHARDSPFKYLPKDIDPHWVMDIGANEGHVAISAMNAFPNANIICFEPARETYNTLIKNIYEYHKSRVDPNHDRKIILNRLAISDFNGETEINITNFSPANSLLRLKQTVSYTNYNPSIEELRREKIEVSTLDNLRYNHRLPSTHFDIVKIDVEGLEWNVLHGGINFFKNNVDIIIIEISFQRETDPESPSYLKIFNDLDLWGFKLINIYDVETITYDHPNAINDTMVTQMDCVFRKKSEV